MNDYVKWGLVLLRTQGGGADSLISVGSKTAMEPAA